MSRPAGNRSFLRRIKQNQVGKHGSAFMDEGKQLLFVLAPIALRRAAQTTLHRFVNTTGAAALDATQMLYHNNTHTAGECSKRPQAGKPAPTVSFTPSCMGSSRKLCVKGRKKAPPIFLAKPVQSRPRIHDLGNAGAAEMQLSQVQRMKAANFRRRASGATSIVRGLSYLQHPQHAPSNLLARRPAPLRRRAQQPSSRQAT